MCLKDNPRAVSDSICAFIYAKLWPIFYQFGRKCKIEVAVIMEGVNKHYTNSDVAKNGRADDTE